MIGYFFLFFFFPWPKEKRIKFYESGVRQRALHRSQAWKKHMMLGVRMTAWTVSDPGQEKGEGLGKKLKAVFIWNFVQLEVQALIHWDPYDRVKHSWEERNSPLFWRLPQPFCYLEHWQLWRALGHDCLGMSISSCTLGITGSYAHHQQHEARQNRKHGR